MGRRVSAEQSVLEFPGPPEGVVGRGAIFSPCQRYRYRLWRRWDERPTLVFLMLNPSTADVEHNDPTVERCERRARREGYGGVEVVNIFAWRDTDPALMKLADEPVGAENDAAIREALAAAGRVVCAWGCHGTHRGRDVEIRRILRECGVRPYVFGFTQGGQPRHPLFLSNSLELVPWDLEEVDE